MPTQTVRPVRGRFAPSPSGRMHLGNLYAALLAWLDVRHRGGTLLLRMEDLDPQRCRLAYARQVAEDLLWLGLSWDEGWRPDEPESEYAQSTREEHYAACFRRLEKQGLVYPCYCTRAELRGGVSAPHLGEMEHYDGRCRTLTAEVQAKLEAAGRNPAWRVMVPHRPISLRDGNYGSRTVSLATTCGDFVLRRSDGVYAYQLAAAADDGAMGVTRVVRGRDLLPSAHRQSWLMEKLGWEPPEYAHVPLLLSGDGRRLSKRDGDLDMGALRRAYTPEELTGRLAVLAGLRDRVEPVSPLDLTAEFDWSKVGTADRTVPSGLF